MKHFTQGISSDRRVMEKWIDHLNIPKGSTVLDMTGNVGSEGIFMAE